MVAEINENFMTKMLPYYTIDDENNLKSVLWDSRFDRIKVGPENGFSFGPDFEHVGDLMNTEYLPGDVRQRIQDLIKEKDTNQSAVASAAGISDSTLSRFLSGTTDKLSNQSISAIADALGVTTDFLLGKVNIPYRTNYDIQELGLTADAAKVLYTNRTAAAVVSAMLESKQFPIFAQMVRQYIEGTVAAGYAAQNQMYGMLTNMIGGLGPEAAMDVAALRKPVNADELNNIHETLDRMLKGIREDTHAKLEASRAITAEIMQQMMEGLPKGKDIQSVTPEQIVDAITATVSGMDGVSDEMLDSFKQAALPLFQLPNETNDGTQDE